VVLILRFNQADIGLAAAKSFARLGHNVLLNEGQ
jgi:NAD(P)-dependent dehydrogenase (short-subunit alcohol dehydrogenase family)